MWGTQKWNTRIHFIESNTESVASRLAFVQTINFKNQIMVGQSGKLEKEKAFSSYEWNSDSLQRQYFITNLAVVLSREGEEDKFLSHT